MMKYLFGALITAAIFSSCGKDNYTTEPQIEFKEFKPSGAYRSDLSLDNMPYVVFELRDGEGDISNADSAKIVIKNIESGREFFYDFPDLGSGATKDLKIDIEVGMFEALPALKNIPRPYTDTVAYEIYVTDLAGHESNTILAQPFYLIND